jgi:hypothetical protein
LYNVSQPALEEEVGEEVSGIEAGRQREATKTSNTSIGIHTASRSLAHHHHLCYPERMIDNKGYDNEKRIK